MSGGTPSPAQQNFGTFQQPKPWAAPQAQGAPGQPNVFNTAANALNQSTNAFGAGTQFSAPQNVGAYANPFASQVAGQTLQDLNRARQMAINTTGDQALQAGAFGGSRLGVAEAETNRNFADAAARQMGDLAYRGFGDAMSNARADQQMRMNAAQGLLGAGSQAFNMGNTINENTMRQGAQQRAMMQALIDAQKKRWADFSTWGDRSAAANANVIGAAAGAAPPSQSITSKNNPGLFDWLF